MPKTYLLLCHALNVLEIPRRILCEYLGQVPVWRSGCKKKRNKILKILYCFILLPASLEHRKSKRVPEKHILQLYWLYQNLSLCRSQQTMENSSKDGIPDHLTWLLRNLYEGQEATVRNGHGRMDWFQFGKGVCQGCILSPCLFKFYAEYIMQNAGLDEAQARIKIARRNINNFRYADDTTLTAESEEELKSLLM